LFAFVAIVCAPTIALAGQATCSNPGLPVGAAASPDLLPGRLTLNLTSGLLPISEAESLQEGAQLVRYDTDLVLVETRLAAEYVLTPNLAIGASVPYRVVDVDVQTSPMSNQMIHVRTERLTGIGDAQLTLHYARELPGAWRLHARAGTSIPLGSTVEDPHALGAIGQEHQHIQFGSGTFIPSLAVEAQHAFGPVTASTFALAHLSLYENDHGYKQGHRFSGGIAGSSSFGLRDFTFGLGLEAHGETAERWQGEIPMEEGNEGRIDFLLGPSAAYRFADGFAVVADVKLPVYSHVVGNQLDYGVVIGVGLVAAFDVKPRPSWKGLDQQPLDPATPTLMPVPGRVTVFDLWATWCAPCRDLDTRLVALAKRYPQLAVRKLEVGDPDSEAWKRHLAPGSFDLPHLKLYDAKGALVFEKTAPPAELVKAVEAYLSALSASAVTPPQVP
jgi:thiol-disulfide isomerase/thioredoxin